MKDINIKEIIELIIKIGISTIAIISGILIMALYEKLGIQYPTNIIIGAMCFVIGVIFAIIDLIKFRMEKTNKNRCQLKSKAYESKIKQLEDKITSLEIEFNVVKEKE